MTAASTGRPTLLRIGSYNIHGAVGTDGRFSAERVARVLAEMDLDIVALQEVPLGGKSAPDVLAALQEATGMTAVSGATQDTLERRYGNAVLSRWPVRAVRSLNLSHGTREPRGALDADIDCAGQLLRIVATHLGLSARERRGQIAALLEAFDTPRLPVILMGDLNEWFVWGRPLRMLTGHFRKAPAPRTFPTRYPIFALDRIWVHPGEWLIGVSVHRSAIARVTSDHFPVVARIQVLG